MRVVFKTIVIAFIFLTFVGLFIYIHENYMISYIKSSSMEPTYFRGDIVIIKKVSPDEINVGDVIVFREPGSSDLILHRVVAIKEENAKRYFLTKGDNPRTNPQVDPWGWVPEDNVVGILVACVPYLGWIFLFFDEPSSRLMLILLILLVFFLYWSAGEEKDAKFLFMTGYMRASKIKVCLIIVLLCFLGFSVFFGVIGKTNVNVKISDNIPVYPLDKDKLYVVVNMEITSRGSMFVSVSMIQLTVKNNNATIGYGEWKINYPFFGKKTVSIAILLDLSQLKSLPLKIDIVIDATLTNYITGQNQKYQLGSKSFRLSV